MTESLFRIDAPTEQDLVNFDRDGYIAYPDVMTDQGRQGLIDEVITREQVVEFLTMTEAERLQVKTPHRGNVNRLNAHGVHVRPWNNRGPWGFEMFDAPLVKALLLATVGPGVHMNHTTLHLTLRGERPIPLHHDMEPPNLEDRHKWFVFMLYYPNGFGLGDHNLRVIPGSHRIDDWGEHQPYGPCAVPGRGESHKDCDMAELLNELYGDQVQRKLEVVELELPPGSMVFINARTYHGVRPKPEDAPDQFRLFCNCTFSQADSQGENIQTIPAQWLENADPWRRQLFDRPPFDEGA